MSPETVLAQRGDLKVTRADYDVELLRLPPDIRGGFATSEKRVADLLTRMLLTKEAPRRSRTRPGRCPIR